MLLLSIKSPMQSNAFCLKKTKNRAKSMDNIYLTNTLIFTLNFKTKDCKSKGPTINISTNKGKYKKSKKILNNLPSLTY
jgi:hypothetical protein